MEYVKIDSNSREVNWDNYFEYLKKQKANFPKSLYEYAIDWGNYSLDSKNSLHDSWLEKIKISSGSNSGNVEGISLTLLGSYHDRKHILKYTHIRSYNLNIYGTNEPKQRDILAHEFRVKNDFFTHEICFTNLDFISIEFESLDVSHNMLK